MASEVGEKGGVVDDGSEMTYKVTLLDGEPEEPQSDFHPDPSILNTSNQHPKKEGKDGDKDGVGQNIQTSLMISGAVVAAIGAIMVLLKKIKET